MRHKHRILHYWMLVAVGACETYRKGFVELFGYKAAISKKNILKAREYGLWIFWFMDKFVGDDKRVEYDTYLKDQLDDHACDINYDFAAAHERIIDKFLELFESNSGEYYWSEDPFGVKEVTHASN